MQRLGERFLLLDDQPPRFPALGHAHRLMAKLDGTWPVAAGGSHARLDGDEIEARVRRAVLARGFSQRLQTLSRRRHVSLPRLGPRKNAFRFRRAARVA